MTARMVRPRKSADTSTYSGRTAARLRELREVAGLSVDEAVARLRRRKVSVAAPTIYHWEAGDRVVNLDLVPALAAVYGVPAREIFPEA